MTNSQTRITARNTAMVEAAQLAEDNMDLFRRALHQKAAKREAAKREAANGVRMKTMTAADALRYSMDMGRDTSEHDMATALLARLLRFGFAVVPATPDFFAAMTDEQREAILAYAGREDRRDAAFPMPAPRTD